MEAMPKRQSLLCVYLFMRCAGASDVIAAAHALPKKCIRIITQD
jgi:hypothetical protein